MNNQDIEKALLGLKNPKKAVILQRFFKTGKGEYGEGDIFLGITVPKQREIAKKYQDLSLNDLQKLLQSKIHEYRLTSLLILNIKYKQSLLLRNQKSNIKGKEEIFKFYLANTININNWDLVDLSTPNIVGEFLFDKNRSVLFELAKSKNLWEKRIAILSTYFFIKNNQFDDALKIAEILLEDEHDLMHKAVGWMLREIGKRDQKVEEDFLNKYYKKMPRTMLRYAIEKFNEKKRKLYLK